MPRARNPAREKAREMWLASGKTAKLKDIARKLNLPEVRIRKWKCEDKWESNKDGGRSDNYNSERSLLSEPDINPPPSSERKRGGQPGNKNGKGAPAGNKRAIKTGEFEKIFFNSLTNEEISLIKLVPKDKETLLKQQIFTLLIRERRMLNRISQLKQDKNMLTKSITTIAKPKGYIKKEKKGTDDIETTSVNVKKIEAIQQECETKDDRILRIEDSLTRVQAELRRYIDSLIKMQPQEEDGKNIVKDWIAALANIEHEDCLLYTSNDTIYR